MDEVSDLNNFLIMGPAGSGKGTQAKLLAEKFGIPSISMGGMFREVSKQDSELGRQVKELIDNGIMVSDEKTNEIILKRLNEDDCKQGFVLDGYPRNIGQAEFLEKHRAIKKAIFFEVSEAEVIKRMTARRVCSKCKTEFNVIYIKPKQEGVCDGCGGELVMRDDDKPDAIKQRLRIFHNDTAPVIDLYEKKGVLLRINGEQSIEKVFKDLVAALGD